MVMIGGWFIIAIPTLPFFPHVSTVRCDIPSLAIATPLQEPCLAWRDFQPVSRCAAGSAWKRVCWSPSLVAVLLRATKALEFWTFFLAFVVTLEDEDIGFQWISDCFMTDRQENHGKSMNWMYNAQIENLWTYDAHIDELYRHSYWTHLRLSVRLPIARPRARHP